MAPHTSGLFADMTVDGPEIGTLVLIVDRAKNLPNRKTMGKQNPYCAARLGKEAKKTDTDRRGGQTPRWDQELRFTVHESPDYNRAKISIFSEDKRTDLIGEAWVDLTKVVTRGGGKADLWQGLTCKGKYAGELRIELTYYDSRPKPETPDGGVEDLSQSVGNGASRVKRRPLPNNPNGGTVTPDNIPGLPNPGRAKHGPRDLRPPPRANSMPPESTNHSQPQGWPDAQPPMPGQEQHHGSYAGVPMQQTPPNQYHGEYDQYQDPGVFDTPPQGQPQQPDFLPQLPPSNRQRRPVQPALQSRPHLQQNLVHSNSAPMLHQGKPDPGAYQDGYQLRTDYPDPIPDLDYQHQQVVNRPRKNSAAPPWQREYSDPYVMDQQYGEEPSSPPPPPPPVHSNSAPVVPHFQQGHGPPITPGSSSYSGTPPSARHYSVPNSSPMQSTDRNYAVPQRTPVRTQPGRGSSVDGFTPSPEQYAYESPPANYPSAQGPSPYPRAPPSNRNSPQRHSVVDPYLSTPPRPHPLSQEVPRPRSPQPHHPLGMSGSSSQPNGPSPNAYSGGEPVPIFRPRALSPQPAPPPPQANNIPRPKSSYSIQHPIRAFESSDNSPLSTSRTSPGAQQLPHRPTPPRKSVSPHPTTPTSAGSGVPFSPDSFDIHNPNARQATLPDGNPPHRPYQVSPGSSATPQETNGPIVNWHGQEIDPSDRLPVDSWAPEPEKKVPSKTYGLGRERDFGPRNLSRDTVVNFRNKPQTPPEPEPSPTRNRLQKKSGGGSGNSPNLEPLRERHNYNSVSAPNAYAQQDFGQGFYHGDGTYAASTDTLAQEISNIDIGSGRHSRGGSVPPPTAYAPVKSHRDRRSFY